MQAVRRSLNKISHLHSRRHVSAFSECNENLIDTIDGSFRRMSEPEVVKNHLKVSVVGVQGFQINCGFHLILDASSSCELLQDLSLEPTSDGNCKVDECLGKSE
jgi:hypothetical protein